jgi:hypothetical protein
MENRVIIYIEGCDTLEWIKLITEQIGCRVEVYDGNLFYKVKRKDK